MKIFGCICFVLLFSYTGFSQKFEIGVSTGPSLTFAHKTKNSNYDPANFKTKPHLGVGVFLTANYRLKDTTLYLCSGIGIQYKSYNFSLYNFGFDQIEGYKNLIPRFKVYELPFHIQKTFNRYYLETGGGVSYNINDQYIYNSSEPDFKYITSKEDTVISEFLMYDSFSNFFSFDLFLSMGYRIRRFDLSLSYLYGLALTTRYTYNAYVQLNSEKHEFNPVIEPRLSYLALRITYYPDISYFNRDKKYPPNSPHL